MDGVPGVSYAGIKPGTTFTYRFPVNQSGLYSYHSHSGARSKWAPYAPIIFDPIERDPVEYDREATSYGNPIVGRRTSNSVSGKSTPNVGAFRCRNCHQSSLRRYVEQLPSVAAPRGLSPPLVE